MFNFDNISFSGECGRINPDEPEPLKKDICCPLICTKKDKTAKQKNFSALQCVTRILVGNPCVTNCKIGQRIRRKMIKNGFLRK